MSPLARRRVLAIIVGGSIGLLVSLALEIKAYRGSRTAELEIYELKAALEKEGLIAAAEQVEDFKRRKARLENLAVVTATLADASVPMEEVLAAAVATGRDIDLRNVKLSNKGVEIGLFAHGPAEAVEIAGALESLARLHRADVEVASLHDDVVGFVVTVARQPVSR